MNKWTERLYHPCIHRGEMLSLVEICSCTGRKKAGIYKCLLKGECTVLAVIGERQTCQSCTEYHRATQLPQ